MSQEYAWPSSSQLEFEARRMHATARSAGWAELAPVRILKGLPQALDFFVWALAATIIFPQVFFPGLSAADGIVVGLVVWALAPAMRWIRLPIFAELQRRHGRGVRLTAARVLLGASTAAIAFLPEASQSVWAPGVLLVSCRLFQGLAMNGLSEPAAGPRAWHVSESRASRAAVCGLTSLIGLLIAGGLFGVLAAALEQPDFLQWGWRYPFVMGIAVNIVALFADLRLLATQSGKPSSERCVRLATVSGVPVDQGTR